MGQSIYNGNAGQTRRERVLVPDGDGHRIQEVLRGVNVATDPSLRDAALRDQLQGEGPLALAIPYVFHDPNAQRFVLVVPEVLAHTSLRERGCLLQSLAEEDGDLPAYVSRCDVVIGARGLAAYLEGPSTEAAAQGLERREARLQARAEGVTSAEDELRVKREQLRAEERRLIALAAELSDREEALTVAELEGESTAARIHPETLAEDEGELDLADAVELVEGDGVDAERRIGPGDGSESHRGSGESERIEEGQVLEEPDEEGDGFAPAELLEDVELLGDEDLAVPEEREFEDAELLDADELVDAELIEDDAAEPEEYGAELVAEGPIEAFAGLISDEEELSLVDAAVAGSLREAEDGEETAERTSVAPSDLRDTGAPPEDFLRDAQAQMAVGLGDELLLFVRLPEGDEQAFRSDVELLGQFVAVDEVPVAMLALVQWREGRPLVRRCALGGDEASSLLKRLAQGTTVSARLFSAAGNYERSIEVGASQCRGNWEMLLGRLDGSIDARELARAQERALVAPPPVRLAGHPFGNEEPAANAKEAFARVAALTKWAAPAKLELALLGLALPNHQVNAAFERTLADALRFGIALSDALVGRALELGLAPDESELLHHLALAFAETAAKDGAGGLSQGIVERNWERLLEAGEHRNLVFDAVVYDLIFGSLPAPEDADADELRLLLKHPVHREAAVRKVIAADEYFSALGGELPGALGNLSEAGALGSLAAMVERGEQGLGMLIDALESPMPGVRHGAALALGELAYRRAITPLVQALNSEEQPWWPDLGRILGTFGTGKSSARSLASAVQKALSRALKDDGERDERVVHALAHLWSEHSTLEEKWPDDERRRELRGLVRSQAPAAEEHRRWLAEALAGGSPEPNAAPPGAERALRFAARRRANEQGSDPQG